MTGGLNTSVTARLGMWAIAGVLGGVGCADAGDTDAQATTDEPTECVCSPGECGINACGATCGCDAGFCDAGTCSDAANCQREGIVLSTQTALIERRGVRETLRYEGRTRATAPFDRLVIEHFGQPPSVPPLGPGTYDIGSDDYRDCETCVLLESKCNDLGCPETFLASGGLLTIDRVDGQLVATLDDAHFVQVYIDDTDYGSIPLPNGDTWCVDEVGVDAVIDDSDTPEACAPTGTGKQIGDKIADVSLVSCTGEPYSLHSRCGVAAAVWVVLAAGWCEVCSEHLPEVAETYAARKEFGLDVVVVLGEDTAGAKPTQAYCQEYAAAHGLDPAVVYIDHDGTQSFAAVQEAVELYMPAGTLSLPWDGLLRGDGMLYLWTPGEVQGDLSSLLDQLLDK